MKYPTIFELRATPSLPEQTCVLQIGPGPGTTGGIASVIEEYLSLDVPNVQMKSVVTWLPVSRARRAVVAIRGLTWMIVHAREWDVAHVHMSEYGSFIREGIALTIARLLGKSTVATMHGAHLAQQISMHPRLTRAVLDRADILFTLGPNHSRLVKGTGTTSEVREVFNPISADALAPQPTTNEHYVVFVGELGRRKGVDRLLAACRNASGPLQELEVVLAGPLTHEINLRQLDSVHYLGELPRGEARGYLARASAVVLPSRAEVLPMVLVEALAMGTPAIYTTVGEWALFEGCPGVTLIDTRDQDEEAIVQRLALALASVQPPSIADRIKTREWIFERAGRPTVSGILQSAYAAAQHRRENLNAVKARQAKGRVISKREYEGDG